MGRPALALAACLLASSTEALAAGRTTDARKLYNQELYELAIRAASWRISIFETSKSARYLMLQ